MLREVPLIEKSESLGGQVCGPTPQDSSHAHVVELEYTAVLKTAAWPGLWVRIPPCARLLQLNLIRSGPTLPHSSPSAVACPSKETCISGRRLASSRRPAEATRAQPDYSKLTAAGLGQVTAVEISGWRSHDTNYFRPLLATTAKNVALRDVTADTGYSSKSNHQAVADAGGTPFIAFKGSHAGQPIPRIDKTDAIMPRPDTSAWTRMYHMFAYQRDAFLARYHQRSNVETTFSMIKAKFGDSLRSKSDVGQINEVLCKVIAHNLCVLIACIHEIGLEVSIFRETPASVVG